MNNLYWIFNDDLDSHEYLFPKRGPLIEL